MREARDVDAVMSGLQPAAELRAGGKSCHLILVVADQRADHPLSQIDADIGVRDEIECPAIGNASVGLSLRLAPLEFLRLIEGQRMRTVALQLRRVHERCQPGDKTRVDFTRLDHEAIVPRRKILGERGKGAGSR